MMLWCPSTIHNMPYYCLYALVTTSNYVLHCIIIFVLYCISLLSAFMFNVGCLSHVSFIVCFRIYFDRWFSVAPCFLLYFLSICLDYFHLCVVCLLFLAPIQPSVFIQHINSLVRMYLLCSCKCSQSAALCCYSPLCFWMKSPPPQQFPTVDIHFRSTAAQESEKRIMIHLNI